MPIINKLRTAVRILQTRGLNGVITTTREKLTRASRPDESFIAFQALTACGVTGTMIDVGAHHGGSLAPLQMPAGGCWPLSRIQTTGQCLPNASGTTPRADKPAGPVRQARCGSGSLFQRGLHRRQRAFSFPAQPMKPAEKVQVTTLREFLKSQI